MKTAPLRLKVLAVCVLLLITIPVLAQDEKPPQMVFGVKPGMLIQSSYFGLSKQKFQPFIGLDWVALAVETEGGDLSGSVIIPHIGAKLFLKPSGVAHHVAPYLTGDWFFSFASVSVDHYTPEEEELAKDVLEFWGLGIGFGAEYFFSECFSVGGEYGLRYVHDGVEEHEKTVDNGWGPHVETVNQEFSLAFRLTYAAVTANFHF